MKLVSSRYKKYKIVKIFENEFIIKETEFIIKETEFIIKETDEVS